MINQVYHQNGDSTLSGEERAAMRDDMLEMAGGPMRFETAAKKVFRHGPTATMVRQLLFWEGKGGDPEGYVYKSVKDWYAEEALTRTEIDTARRKLGDGDKGCGVLDERKTGRAPCTVHYRLRLKKLFEVMLPELDPPTVEDPVPENSTLNPSVSLQGSDKPVCRVSANQFAGLRPTHNRDYSENTSETTSGRNEIEATQAPCPATAEPLDKESSNQVPPTQPEPAMTSVTVSGGDDLRKSAAGQERIVGGLEARLEEDGHYLDAEQRRNLKANFGHLLKKDLAAGELEKVVERMVKRWGHISLSPQKALGDVRGDGKSDAGQGGSSPEVIECIRTYAIKGYAPGDDVGPSIAMDREKLAKIATRFDFASEADPPMPIRLEISDSRQFCDKMLHRLRLIAQRAVREAQVKPYTGDSTPAAEVPAARIVSKGLEDGPEGRRASEDGDGGSSTILAVERMLHDEDSAPLRLARGVVGGKGSAKGPITKKDVALAIENAVNLPDLGLEPDAGPLGAGYLASLLIRRVRDRDGVKELVAV